MSVYDENIIPIKIAHLAEYVSRVKRISLDDALGYIYVNPMYERLYDEGAKWWYLSTDALYEEFELRRNRQNLQVPRPVFEFYTYCLENFATRKRISGMQEWESIDQFKTALREYIRYYNNDRIKLRLNGQSPVQYRALSQSQAS